MRNNSTLNKSYDDFYAAQSEAIGIAEPVDELPQSSKILQLLQGLSAYKNLKASL